LAQLGCIAAAIGMGAPAALAGGFSYETFFVSAKTGSGDQGFFLLTIDHGDYDPLSGTYDWSVPEAIEIRDVFSNELIATIMSAEIHYALGGPAGPQPGGGNPIVNLDFAIQADDELTEITVTSALLDFDTINGAEGRSSAGITVTDLLGDGAAMNGLQPDGNMYTAQYNGLAPGGTQFTSFFDTLEASDFGSNSTSAESAPGGAFLPIGDPVNNMSSQFNFSLTPFDLASGTSTWEIVPAPGAIALLALGGLVGTRRRRG
jgi:hypothetical protein